jgi:hypothetical protein
VTRAEVSALHGNGVLESVDITVDGEPTTRPAQAIVAALGYAGAHVALIRSLEELKSLAPAATVAKAARGARISVSYGVKNQGGAPTGPYTMGFVLAPVSDPTGASDIDLGPGRTGVSLPAGQSQGFTDTVLIPAGVSPGVYRVRVVADATNLVVEADETNNASLTGLLTVIAP